MRQKKCLESAIGLRKVCMDREGATITGNSATMGMPVEVSLL